MEQEARKEIKFYQRNLIINKELQAGLIGYSVLLITTVFTGQYLLHAYVFDVEMPFAEGIQLQHITVFGIIFLFFVAVLFFGMHISNRIAGPIHRLKNHLDEIDAGKDVPDLTFRKQDYFHELLGPYNKLVKKSKK